jgi:hypothetical protein
MMIHSIDNRDSGSRMLAKNTPLMYNHHRSRGVAQLG